jgi:hypothetical protein
MRQAEIENFFTYHPPHESQIPLFAGIREAAKRLAEEINKCCPPSADQTAAIRKVREAVMTANAAIACFPISVTIEQVADQITFKSYYLDNMLTRHETTKFELTAIGEVDKALQGFYEMSAKICGHGMRPEAFQYAACVAADMVASMFSPIPFQKKQ